MKNKIRQLVLIVFFLITPFFCLKTTALATNFGFDTTYPELFINPNPVKIGNTEPIGLVFVNSEGIRFDLYIIPAQYDDITLEQVYPETFSISVEDSDGYTQYYYIFTEADAEMVSADASEGEIIQQGWNLQGDGDTIIPISYSDLSRLLNVRPMHDEGDPRVEANFNEVKDLISTYLSDIPYSTPSTDPVSIGSTDIGTLITNGTFTLPVGESTTDTTKITVNNDVSITVGEGSTATATIITLNKDTEITAVGTSAFDASLLSAMNIDTNVISNSDSNLTVKASIQWGIPGVTLLFSQPVEISMYLGDNYNGQTLSILRSSTTSDGWTNDGITAPATCLVANGYCNFSTTKASYFSANQNTSTPSTNNNSNNNSAPTCGDAKPSSTPDLFQVNTKSKSAKLFFTPINNTNQFVISYSTKPSAEEYGATVSLAKEGVQNFTIDKLKPNTIYYIKVRGQNGCMPGDWSNIMKFKTNSKTYYKTTPITKKLATKLTKTTNQISKTTINNPATVGPTLIPVKETPTQTKQIQQPEVKRKCFLWWCW